MPDSPVRSGPFPRAQRLRKPREFEAVKAEGRRWDAGLFVAQARWVTPAPVGLAARKVGLVASRRIGDSVRRQRAKRLLREAWRWERDVLPAGIEVVLVARPGLPASTSTEVRRRLRQAFTELARRGPRTAPVPAAPAPAAPLV